jgi:hypothetical protein
MPAKDFWRWPIDEIGPAAAMTAIEKKLRSQAELRTTGIAATQSALSTKESAFG